jgi:hypothetical protein
MVIGTCKYCKQSNVPLVESHLLPSGIYDLVDLNGEFIMVNSRVVSHTSRHLKYPLLCEPCDGSLSTHGENWAIPLLATEGGPFPFYDLLTKVAPDVAAEDLVGYAASRNVEIDVEKLTHFALGIFWKASVHSWKRGETNNWIELGRYSEEIRLFLRCEGPFPKHVAITVGVLPGPLKHVWTCMPYRGSNKEYHSYIFQAPGITFALGVGKLLGDTKKNCFYSNPLHPIVVAITIGDIATVLRNATKNARLSRRIVEEARARGVNPSQKAAAQNWDRITR